MDADDFDVPPAPHEATRAQSRRARAEKAAKSRDRLAVPADVGGDLRDNRRSPLERAAVLLTALGEIGSVEEVRVCGTPAAVRADVGIRPELTDSQHERLLDALSAADQFGHSITRLTGERGWASFESTPLHGRQPHGGAVPRTEKRSRPVPESETASFFTAPTRSTDARYHPPV
ncbi:hypothetical protein ACFY2N_34110 [Streptomyces rubiginosohelvolus]|uniref:hypothetical protein n=1 Tax=Streptomyces rubiginosohelvolus TaxID=67362 RepID=UPI0036AE0B74